VTIISTHDSRWLSQLVQVYTFDFIRLDTQVIQDLSLGIVIEADHQFWNTHVEGDPLMIPPGLAEDLTVKKILS
jgi:hypothetical protein